jgi:hypothetical protein
MGYTHGYVQVPKKAAYRKSDKNVKRLNSICCDCNIPIEIVEFGTIFFAIETPKKHIKLWSK